MANRMRENGIGNEKTERVLISEFFQEILADKVK